MKTYASAKGAKAAAKKAGVDMELLQIVEVQTEEGLRYGYTSEAQQAAASTQPAANTLAAPLAESEPVAPAAAPAPADSVVTTAKASKPVKVTAPKPQRIEQNGVKRPGPGKCLEVWEWLDESGNCMPKDLQPVAEAKGWNLNNAQIELYQWRKFNGIAGRQAKAAK